MSKENPRYLNKNGSVKIIDFKHACAELFIKSFFDEKFRGMSIPERAKVFGIYKAEDIRDIFEFPS